MAFFFLVTLIPTGPALIRRGIRDNVRKTLTHNQNICVINSSELFGDLQRFVIKNVKNRLSRSFCSMNVVNLFIHLYAS